MDWITGPGWADAGVVAASGLAIYTAVIVANRLNGLRTFAKMSGYDFASTVAIGSILASVTLTRSTSIASGIVAVATVVVAQRILTALRRRRAVLRVVDNAPALLVHGGHVLDDELRRAGIAPADLREKVRAAGATCMGDVAAVVLETSGDVSVILGDASRLEGALFVGVRGGEQV